MPTFQFCIEMLVLVLFGIRTKTSFRSYYDVYCIVPVEGTLSPVNANSFGILDILTGQFLDLTHRKRVILCLSTALNVIQHQQKLFHSSLQDLQKV